MRKLAIAVALMLLILVLTPSGVFAKHTATVTNSPLGATLSTLTTFTLSVTNETGPGNADINEVELTVDANWAAAAQVDQPTPPSGWSVGVSGNVITASGMRTSAAKIKPAVLC